MAFLWVGYAIIPDAVSGSQSGPLNISCLFFPQAFPHFSWLGNSSGSFNWTLHSFSLAVFPFSFPHRAAGATHQDLQQTAAGRVGGLVRTDTVEIQRTVASAFTCATQMLEVRVPETLAQNSSTQGDDERDGLTGMAFCLIHYRTV